MKDEHDEEKKFAEATEVCKELLDTKPYKNKYNPNRRRSSILEHLHKELDEELDDLKIQKRRSGSHSRRNSSIPGNF